jgi:hypothetical protein
VNVSLFRRWGVFFQESMVLEQDHNESIMKIKYKHSLRFAGMKLEKEKQNRARLRPLPLFLSRREDKMQDDPNMCSMPVLSAVLIMLL